MRRDEGWVPAFRKLFNPEHDLAPDKRAPASRLHAWLDLCQMAAHEPFTHKGVPLEAGELLAAIRFLARRWGWSKSRVERFVSDQEARTRIETVRGTERGTVYRIVNYDTYAGFGEAERDTSEDAHRDRSGTAAGQRQQLNHSTITTNDLTNSAPADEFSTPTLAGYLGEYAGCLHGMSEMTQKAIMGLVGPNGTEQHRWARLEAERRPPLLASVIQSYRAARDGQSWHRGFFLSMVDSAVRDARKPPPTSEAAQHTTDSERAKIAAQRAAARRFDEEQRRKMQDGAPSVTSISDIMGKLKPGDAA